MCVCVCVCVCVCMGADCGAAVAETLGLLTLQRWRAIQGVRNDLLA